MMTMDRKAKINFVETTLLVLLFLFVGTLFIGTLCYEKNIIFDDSFISFRYAKNLAEGNGITWNPGVFPRTEGYTNFLFVVLLAPFIRAGLDVLLVAQVLSGIAALGICILCFYWGRKLMGWPVCRAILLPLIFLASSRTASIVMLGMETVVYAFALALSFTLALKYYKNRQIRHLFLCGLASFCTVLLRPDGILFPAVFGLVSLFVLSSPGAVFKQFFKAWLPTLVLPMALYLSWKYAYYGDIFPNPFYIKAAARGLIAPSGFWSVLDFLDYHRVLLALGILSLFCFFKNSASAAKPGTCLAVCFVLVYVLFYLRVDTLMDAYGRFLFPLVPFLIFLIMPILDAGFTATSRCGGYRGALVLAACFVLFFSSGLFEKTIAIRRAMLGKFAHAGKNSMMQKEYRLSKVFAQYPRIHETMIALGDVGVFGYFSGARILDTVGLNDTFISRNTDILKFADYLFEQNPTLVLQAATPQKWFTDGHGPKYTEPGIVLFEDSRWDGYEYVGTITFSSLYDLHLFLNKSYDDYEGFREFIAARIIDKKYEVFPLSIGTYMPPGK